MSAARNITLWHVCLLPREKPGGAGYPGQTLPSRQICRQSRARAGYTCLAGARPGRHWRHPRATTALLEALAIGEPGNYLRTFLEPGQPIEKLLSDLPVSAYRDRLLAAFGKEEPQRPKDISQDASLPETLIDREFAILRLMAAGMSNREIRDEIIPLRKYHSLVRQADLYEIGGFGSWRRCSAGTSTRLDLT